MALQFPTLKQRSAVRTCLRLALTGHLSEGCRNHLARGGDRSQYSLRVQSECSAASKFLLCSRGEALTRLRGRARFTVFTR